MRRIVGRRLRAAPVVCRILVRRLPAAGRRPRAAPASRSMAAVRCSIRVAAVQMSALLRGTSKEKLGSYLQLSALRLCPVLPFGTQLGRIGLAARKTLANKQNISDGYGAKLHQARALLTSLLVTEKPGQFRQATPPCVLGRSSVWWIPPHARQQETQGLP